MKKALHLIFCLVLLGTTMSAQVDSTITSLVDVVWLKDGSRLVGSITHWDLDRGLELKLASGSLMSIPKRDISHVFQQVKAGTEHELVPARVRPPYAFKEVGLYHQLSAFFHGSADYGGTGIQYAIGYRFNRKFSLGAGVGYETNEIHNSRNLYPLFVEARGFLKAERVSPYYAMKLGYSLAEDNEVFGETGSGGIYIAPEVGLRIGSRKVNFFCGIGYKLQQATFTTDWGPDYSFTDKVTYKRIELRTGILF